MPIKKVKLSLLVTDAGTDVRHEINDDIVDEYGQSYKKKVDMPPLIVFDCDDEGLILADGFHRYFGCERQGIKEVQCDVRKGIRTDAIKYALGANVTHGLRRTNLDKRHAVEIGLKEFPTHSDRKLAEMCAVSHTFVSEVREELDDQLAAQAELEVATAATSNEEKPKESAKPVAVPPRPEKRKGKDGKSYPVPARGKKNAVPPRPPAVTKDSTDIEVPKEIVPFWDETLDEAQRLLTIISEVRSAVKKAQETNNPKYREVDHVDVIAKLDQVYVDLKRVKPYAVCPDCQGVNTKGCPACKGRGFVSEFYWKHSVTEELKNITGRL